jgi:hypothetical protein
MVLSLTQGVCMGQFTQHGYGQADRIEAFWNKPLYGTVSRGKAFDVGTKLFAALIIASLFAAAKYNG